MRWAVDTPVRVGSLAFAAIVETELSVHSAGARLVGVGAKRPLLFIQISGGDICAVDINAQTYAVEEVEHRYPQAIARMTSMLDELA